MKSGVMSRLDHGLFFALALALAVPTAAGCKDDEEETTAEGDEDSSGGEDTGGGGDLSGVGSGSTPPGDGDDGSDWDGDEGSGAGASAGGDGASGGDGGGSTGGSAGSGGASTEEEEASPWGATRAEQCRQPERRAMSASARRSFDQGVRAARAGNTQQARQAFQAALSADSNAYKAAYNLGVLADRAGNESQAMEFYRRALRIQSDYEDAAEGMVTIFLRRGSAPDAIAFVEPLARRNPRNLDLQALYAEVLVRADRYDDAWEAARTALRCDERFVPALTALVKASLKQGRRELAESILEQALQVQDNNAELHYIQGTLYREEEARFRDALREFTRAVQLRPDYAEARMALGVAQLAGGNYSQALQNFQVAAQLAPTLVAVHLNLGDAYRATKQWKQAKASFDKALQMESQLPQAHFNLGLMYMTAGEEYPGLDALQALQKAKEEFTKYRDLMGSRLPRDDISEQYLSDLNRQIERTERRLERERARAEQEAERGARTE